MVWQQIISDGLSLGEVLQEEEFELAMTCLSRIAQTRPEKIFSLRQEFVYPVIKLASHISEQPNFNIKTLLKVLHDVHVLLVTCVRGGNAGHDELQLFTHLLRYGSQSPSIYSPQWYLLFYYAFPQMGFVDSAGTATRGSRPRLVSRQLRPNNAFVPNHHRGICVRDFILLKQNINGIQRYMAGHRLQRLVFISSPPHHACLPSRSYEERPSESPSRTI
jgi:hypothetical protein